jgi:hypothetical protein
MTVAEAEAALTAAKLAYFETPGAKTKAAVAKAEDDLSSAKLDAEREAHLAALASQARAEADRREREAELARLQTLDAEAQAEIDRTVTELVAFERGAYQAIEKINRISSERAVNFQAAKRLSLSLDLSTISKSPPTAQDVSTVVQSEVRRAQTDEQRDGRDNGQVATWLTPAVFAFQKAPTAS